jgi:hypothetical protein
MVQIVRKTDSMRQRAPLDWWVGNSAGPLEKLIGYVVEGPVSMFAMWVFLGGLR